MSKYSVICLTQCLTSLGKKVTELHKASILRENLLFRNTKNSLDMYLRLYLHSTSWVGLLACLFVCLFLTLPQEGRRLFASFNIIIAWLQSCQCFIQVVYLLIALEFSNSITQILELCPHEDTKRYNFQRC